MVSLVSASSIRVEEPGAHLLGLWRGLWLGEAGARNHCSPSLLFSPYDRVAILEAENAYAHWATRRAKGRLATSDLRLLGNWGPSAIIAAQLDFTVADAAGQIEHRRILLSGGFDEEGMLAVLAEAAPAAMIVLNQAYMDEAFR